MLTKINYQKELDKLIDHLQKEEKVPTLLLHSCCAPCSSYVLEYLSSYFKITVLYYNPNIYPESEYSKRIIEQQTLIGEMEYKISGTVYCRRHMIKKSFMRWQRDWKK